MKKRRFRGLRSCARRIFSPVIEEVSFTQFSYISVIIGVRIREVVLS